MEKLKPSLYIVCNITIIEGEQDLGKDNSRRKLFPSLAGNSMDAR